LIRPSGARRRRPRHFQEKHSMKEVNKSQTPEISGGYTGPLVVDGPTYPDPPDGPDPDDPVEVPPTSNP
jgi:hypothetical protein